MQKRSMKYGEHTAHFIRQFRSLPYFSATTLTKQKVFHLHVVITSCGHELIKSRKYIWNGLQRGNKPFAFLQYTLDGKGAYKYEGNVYQLQRGDCIIGIVPHEHVYYIPEKSSGWEFVYLTFAGSEAIRILQKVQSMLGPVFPIKSNAVFSLFYQILEKATVPVEDIFSYSSLAYSFLMMLIHSLLINEYTNTKSLVSRATNYCKEHYQEPITIDHIAQMLRISKSHLERLFHRQSGQTLRKFVENYRMEQAMSQLIHSECSIKTIAAKCGFSNPAYFTAVFKKRYGYTPTEFIRQTHKTK